MKISKRARRDAHQLFRNCLVNGLLDEGRVRQTMALLTARKPRGYLQILGRLHRLVKLDLDQHAARVESAGPLDADVQARVVGQLQSLYGDTLDLKFEQNPSLLGGLRIRVGSDLYDGSVKTRLDMLQESF